MANLLSRFNKTVAGSESKLADYTSKIASTGDFRRIDSLSVIINSWSNILTTPKRSYMFDPEYGSNLYKLVFEPADERTKKEIIREVISSIRTYDNRAILKNVSVVFLSGKKGFNISADVEYEDETESLSVIIAEENYFDFFNTSTT